MAFITVCSTESYLDEVLEGALGPDTTLARTASWDRLLHVVGERPTTGVVVDSAMLEGRLETGLLELATRYPSVWVVLLARSIDPLVLLRLGKRGLGGLVLTPLDGRGDEVLAAVRRGARHGTEALVTRRISPYLPARETRAVRAALRGVQLGWDTETLASRLGLTRPHLSVRLRAVGLPSAGKLLVWAKLLHAARWAGDPGRTGESISRQLDYANGSVFRRTVRNSLGATPSDLRRGDGFGRVLERFAREVGLDHAAVDGKSAA